MIDFYIPTCTSDKSGGDHLATGRIIKRQDGVSTFGRILQSVKMTLPLFPYRPSQSPVRVTCGAALLKEGLNGR